jgi:hypothetical protein
MIKSVFLDLWKEKKRRKEFKRATSPSASTD